MSVSLMVLMFALKLDFDFPSSEEMRPLLAEGRQRNIRQHRSHFAKGGIHVQLFSQNSKNQTFEGNFKLLIKLS